MQAVKYLYMGCRWLVCALAVAVLVMGQSNNVMSVDKLVAFVKSSEKIIKEEKTMTDKQLADFLSRVRLTEKLEPRVIEDLEALDLGPATRRALEKLRVESANLTPSTTKAVLPDEPIPPPSSIEQAKILDDVREYVANYDNNLPDFVCTEVEHRQVAPRPGTRYGGQAGSDPSYTEVDTVTNRLSYFEHKDTKTTILVNNRPTASSYENLNGSTSNGDFGTMLHDLFSYRAQARFEWARWATLRGRLTMVFSFRVLQPNSSFSIGVKDIKREIVAGYTGELFVDKETHKITRLLEVAQDIPADFPIHHAQERLDYDYADIGGRQYLLPYRGELIMEQDEGFSKNLLDFLHYKKYSADSDITYDIPKDLSVPDSSLQETPATKLNCSDPQNKGKKGCQ